jgi:hypothetical protein
VERFPAYTAVGKLGRAEAWLAIAFGLGASFPEAIDA